MEHAYPTLHVNDAATLSRSPINKGGRLARGRTIMQPGAHLKNDDRG
jgi:hypothetical protein